MAQHVPQSHPEPEWTVLSFPDASHLLWRCCVRQAPSKQLEQEVPVEDVAHEPFGFVSDCGQERVIMTRARSRDWIT